MSSRWAERLPRVAGSKLIYPATALLLWLLGLVFLLVLLAIIRSVLQQSIMDELRSDLDSFLNRNRARLFGSSLYAPVTDPGILGDFSFIRVIHQGEYLFFSAGDGGGFDHRELARLDPQLNGCWLRLDGAKVADQDHRYNIISLAPGDNTVIQAGRTDRFSYRLYRDLTNLVVLAGAGWLVLASLLAYLSFRLSQKPLRELPMALAAIRDDPEKQLDPSLAPAKQYRDIFIRINRIISQNRHLVKEMQDGLDHLAHDLRTPMTRLRSVAEYGLQAGDDTHKLRESLSDCLEESQRVLAMLDIMMCVAEAESGTMKLNREDFELKPQIEEILHLYEYLAEDEGVTISAAIADNLMINGDRMRLSQVWANLTDNGIKYNRKNGRLAIEAEPVQDGLQVNFTDTGIGISDQERPRIWERLYRGDRSRSRQGLGLGLNYVKAVVDAHGGHIDVSSSLNQGSRFRVFLPSQPNGNT
jgi:signal transduction histidine kinase